MWKVEEGLPIGVCPYCSTDLDLESEVMFDGEFLSIECYCPSCGGVFSEEYTTNFEGIGVDRAVYGEFRDDTEIEDN